MSFWRDRDGKRELKERLSKIPEDLAALEINTILKSGIIGGPVPEPREALLAIVNAYTLKLKELDDSFAKSKIENSEPQISLKRLQEETKSIIDELDNRGPLSDEDVDRYRMILRINRMSRKLEPIAAKLIPKNNPQKGKSITDNPAGNKVGKESEVLIKSKPDSSTLKYDELVAIRKAWEIGCSTVVMQTVVQLDGDVVTHIDPRYSGEDHRTLHQLHANDVKTAISTWAEVVKLIQSFLKMIIVFAKNK